MKILGVAGIIFLMFVLSGCDDGWIGCGKVFRHEYNKPQTTYHSETNCDRNGRNCSTNSYAQTTPAKYYLHIRESESKNHTMRVNEYEYHRWDDEASVCVNKDDSITSSSQSEPTRRPF